MRENPDRRNNVADQWWTVSRSLGLAAIVVMVVGLFGALASQAEAAPVPPNVSQELDDDSLVVGDQFKLTIVIDNRVNADPVSGLTFSTSQVVGLNSASAESSCTGFTLTTTGSMLQASGGEVPASSGCTVVLSGTVSQAGDQTISISNFTSVAGSSAVANEQLSVLNPALGASMTFVPDTVEVGDETVLHITLTNTSAADATIASFSAGPLPATSSLETFCSSPSGGTSGGYRTFTNQFLAAGSSCSFTLRMTASSAGMSTTSVIDLEPAGFAASSPTSADLTVTPPPPVDVSMSFDDATIDPGDDAVLRITMTNTSNEQGSGGSFTVGPMPGSNSVEAFCNPALPSNSLSGPNRSFSNQSYPANDSCEYVLRLTGAPPGEHTVMINNLTTSLGASASASAVLTVTGDPIGVDLSFDDDDVIEGTDAVLTVTLTNTTALVATNVDFSVGPLAGSVTVEEFCTSASGGASGGYKTFTNQTVPANSSCDFVLRLSSVTPGSYDVQVDDLTSSLGASPTASTQLTVADAPPVDVQMSFDDDVVTAGDDGVLTITVTNDSGLDANSLSFGVGPFAEPGTVEDFCTSPSGSLSGGIRTFTNQYVAPESSCQFVYRVPYPLPGEYTVEINNMTSSLGDSSTVSATITVEEPPRPVIDISFNPNPARAGELVDMTVTLDHSAGVLDEIGGGAITGVTDVFFEDQTTNCLDLGWSQSLETFTIPTTNYDAGETCTWVVTLRTKSAGDRTASISDFTTQIGTLPPVSEVLTVHGTLAQVDIALDKSTLITGESFVATITVDNGAAQAVANEGGFILSGLDGMTLNSVVRECGGGSGSYTFVDGDFMPGEFFIDAGGSCVWTIDLTTGVPGPTTLRVTDFETTLGGGNTSTASLQVQVPPVPTVSMFFDDETVAVGDATTLNLVFVNPALVDATDVSFTTSALGGATITEILSLACAGSIDHAAGVISASGGVLQAGGGCNVRIPVEATAPGTWLIEIDGLTGSTGTAGAASATLVITSPDLCNGKIPTLYAIAGVPTQGTSGDDVILGTAGPDVIDAAEGNDTVCGGAGDDNIVGGPGDDFITGDGGDDKLFGRQGADTIDGGDGDDTIHGNKGDDVLSGAAGEDRIFGYANNDTISGGDDDDRLHGNFGDDHIDGGAGNDRIFGYGDEDVLNGNDGDDLITGNFGDDHIDGGAGNDVLYGADGDDVVSGGPGNDAVNGNSLNDTLTGGAGDDVLDGGINADTCNGNSGTDTATRCETVLGVP